MSKKYMAVGTGQVYTQEFLFGLLLSVRDSGTTNMWNMPRWLQEQYGFSRKASFQVFQDWSDSL